MCELLKKEHFENTRFCTKKEEERIYSARCHVAMTYNVVNFAREAPLKEFVDEKERRSFYAFKKLPDSDVTG